MGQELNNNEAMLQQYMASTIGDVVNDLGGFVQFTITNAYNAGFEAGMKAAGVLSTNTCQVLEYTHKDDSTIKYIRKGDGKYYPQQLFDIIPISGWDKKSFEVNEYSVTKVINRNHTVYSIGDAVSYNDSNSTIVSFVEKSEDKILASLRFENGESMKKLKIVDINDLA